MLSGYIYLVNPKALSRNHQVSVESSITIIIMYCPTCGGRKYSRGRAGCCNSVSLVKRRDDAHRVPMTILSQTGPFQISQRRLSNLWPAGMNRARMLGNRVLGAGDVLGRPYESPDEYETSNQAIEWLKYRALNWPRHTRGCPNHRGGNYDQMFTLRVERLRDAWRTGDEGLLFDELRQTLEFFEALSKLFGRDGGVSPGLYDEVQEMGLHAAPLAAYVPEAMFYLILYMWRMTGYDQDIIRSMIYAIPPVDQAGLYEFAKAMFLEEGHEVALQIVSILSVTDQLQHRDLIAELAAGGL
ncbi:hypothetical protein M430DRAFT_35319, partial [Amorphotheca resinae ATCC 22711]